MASLPVSRLQGSFNVVSGVWPLVHMRSFEAITGPKTDKWLVRTVSGLLVTIGIVQFLSRDDTQDIAMARRLGIGTAATLAAIDVVYAAKGRISKIYLLDAAVEMLWIRRWQREQ
ncbi:hypothetical protein J7E83_19205 [Arthrobacter sp. ISL-48]|uniref:hypothetical protein n=1 Tax=Arthrobacter sp. ISL-48 TaxID=2819110 RepID=UPI001BE7F70F|nr:hypothetical protein [Arthrobacter sp. ISL-48]MBT2534214.1 hypothetical protein [Arthrobacter sp. ISL-48]